MADRIDELTEAEKKQKANLFFKNARKSFFEKKFSETIKHCDEGLKLIQKHNDCFFMRIYAMAKEKNYEDAKNECLNVLRGDQKYVPAHWGLGIVSREKNLFDEALKHYTEAIDIDPSNYATPYNGRGNVYRAINRFKYALNDYTKAIDIDKANDIKDAHPYNWRGLVNHKLKRFDEALNDYTKAIDIDKANGIKDAYPYYNRGLLYFDLCKYDEAKKDYKKAFNYYDAGYKYYKNNAKIQIDNLDKLIKSLDTGTDSPREIIKKTIVVENSIIDRHVSFLNHMISIEPVDSLTFTVLRKWGSYTPIIGGGIHSSKGGGYFIQSGERGIVIDPGFNFIENFMKNGHEFIKITDVLITHAHNDHTADLESLLTILREYNRNLYGGDLTDLDHIIEPKSGSVLENVLKDENCSIEEILNKVEKRMEIKKKVDERFKAKKITFYITNGIFKKYSSFFDLKEASNYEVVCVGRGHYEKFDIGDVQVRVIKAKHDDIVSDMASVGFCFKKDEFTLIYTGDTGFWGMEKVYENLIKEEKYDTTKIVLVANIGGFKRSERSYSNKENEEEKHYYRNHLGRLGVARLVETVNPELCIISEFGKEFDGSRIDIAKRYDEVYGAKTKFLPADIGLCVKLNKINNNIEVEAIMAENDTKNKTFVMPSEVRVNELKENSQLYYHHKDVDSEKLTENNKAEFLSSLLMRENN